MARRRRAERTIGTRAVAPACSRHRRSARPGSGRAVAGLSSTRPMHTRVSIAAPVARSADLTSWTGLPLALRAGRARLGPDLLVEEDRVRRLSELARVTAEPSGRSGRRIEYRMLNGVRQPADTHLDGLRPPLRADRDGAGARSAGRRPRPLGHVHVRPPGLRHRLSRGRRGPPRRGRFPDPGPGRRPRTDRAAGTPGSCARAPGDWVVLPPELAHVTIDLGAGPLVFSDVIDRRATRHLRRRRRCPRASAGTSRRTGGCAPTRATSTRRGSRRSRAEDWSGPRHGRLYEVFRDDPARLSWLSEPGPVPVTWRPACGSA